MIAIPLRGLAVLMPRALRVAAAEPAIALMNARRLICVTSKQRVLAGTELVAVSSHIERLP